MCTISCNVYRTPGKLNLYKQASTPGKFTVYEDSEDEILKQMKRKNFKIGLLIFVYFISNNMLVPFMINLSEYI